MERWLRHAALPGLIYSIHMAAQDCKFLEFRGIRHLPLTCERTRHMCGSHTHMQSKYPYTYNKTKQSSKAQWKATAISRSYGS